jgi:hypothetical protein
MDTGHGTISIGVANFPDISAPTPQARIEAADRALRRQTGGTQPGAGGAAARIRSSEIDSGESGDNDALGR